VPSVATLEQCWRELHTSSPNEKFHVKLCGVSFIDAAGKVLLKEIHRQGGQLMAEGCLNQAIVHEIEEEGESANTEIPGKGRRKGSHIIFYIALFSLLFSAAQAEAQGTTKKSEMTGNPPTELLRLTLDQAVGLALKQNPTAQIAILQAAQSEQDRKIALSELLPQVQMGVTEQWERLNIRAQFGGAAIFPEYRNTSVRILSFPRGRPSMDRFLTCRCFAITRLRETRQTRAKRTAFPRASK